MNKQFLKDAFGWGLILWLIGYILGIILFPVAPSYLLGWIIMPIGILVTLWVLLKKVKPETLKHFIWLGFIWTILAIILDYIFNVRLFKIVGYYKLDIYVYYFSTFILPILIGLKKAKSK